MDKTKDIEYLSEEFGVKTVKLYKFLCKNFHEYEIFKQILRSGTSIGANVTEAESAISKKEFLSKMYIALKEASETLYWLRLLYRCDYLTQKQFNSIYSSCLDIFRLLNKITKTTAENLNI